ncbi:MAG TPA: TIGR03435 family protein [Bryobacteraceae bacterium]|nr:TIGR03435 family protein [Bryobacteraceae bacterium]
MKIQVLLLAACGAGALAMPALAQPQPRPSFEVASVKPNKSGDRRAFFNTLPGGRFRASNIPLYQMILFAYDLKDFQVSGGPAWIRSERFDITAEAEKDPGRDGMRAMLQTLLEDRFHFKYRRETKDLPVYALVVSKSGKLHESEGECGPRPAVLPPPEPGKPPATPCGGFMVSPGNLSGNHSGMDQLTNVLSRFVGRIVLDKTGLTGKYDINLQWTPVPGEIQLPPGAPPPGAIPLPPVDPNGPSIYAALPEQLGLKLESQKAPVETMVIDHIEEPSEN